MEMYSSTNQPKGGIFYEERMEQIGDTRTGTADGIELLCLRCLR
jgi:hypothetical protein